MSQPSVLLLILIAWLVVSMSVYGDQAPGQSEKQRLMITYDSSNSMWGELADRSRKYEAGRSAIATLLQTTLADRQIAFRAYGHRRKDDCRDTELMVPFSDPAVAKAKITEAVASIRPTGKTPITHSLEQALLDFDGRGGDVLLVSDGLETCDIDPCDLVRDWQATGVNIRVHVVGVGLSDLEREAMACIARESSGVYFDADSAETFEDALADAGAAIEAPATQAPVRRERAYALRIRAEDAQGKTYVAKGQLSRDGQVVSAVSTHARNIVDGPGEYQLELGVLLSDGTIYEPVTQAVSIAEPGDTQANVLVARPAIVVAQFLEDGQTHRGAHVSAYRDGKQVFGFRAFDEALAQPGAYEFRSAPNDDNALSLSQVLVAGEVTQLNFELATTITFYVRYVLPDGQSLRRGSELWKNGQKVYSVFSHNRTTVRPGVYELRSGDQNLPLSPVEIDIQKDGETIEVPLDAGWVVIRYEPSEHDYAGTPDRAFLESLDRGNSKYARINVPIAVAPGRYQVNPQGGKGFMAPITLAVGSNETKEVMFVPEPLGEIAIRFEPSEHYSKLPKRAAVYPLDDQEMLSGTLTSSRPKKFLPGRYRVDPRRADTASQEVVVRAHERTSVLLRYQSP